MHTRGLQTVAATLNVGSVVVDSSATASVVATASAASAVVHMTVATTIVAVTLTSACSLQKVLSVVLGRQLHPGRQLLLLQRLIQFLQLLLTLCLFAKSASKVMILLLQALLLDVHSWHTSVSTRQSHHKTHFSIPDNLSRSPRISELAS